MVRQSLEESWICGTRPQYRIDSFLRLYLYAVPVISVEPYDEHQDESSPAESIHDGNDQVD